MSAQRRLSAFFHLIEQDIEAAETLAQKKNHYAGYHCQQAVEKLMKAILLRQGIEASVTAMSIMIDGGMARIGSRSCPIGTTS